jgi:hypothetical protein
VITGPLHLSQSLFFFSLNVHQHTVCRKLTSNQAEMLEMALASRQEPFYIEPKKSKKNGFLPHLEQLH